MVSPPSNQAQWANNAEAPAGGKAGAAQRAGGSDLY